MKSFRALLLCFCILWLALSTPSLAGDAGYRVNNPNPADRLHLRASPSESALSLGKYYNGTQLILLDGDKDWVRVSIGGIMGEGVLVGYMNRRFVTTGFVASAMPEYMSTSSAWELYDQPSEVGGYRMCGYGMEFLLMGFSDNWWHVMSLDGSMTGFVRAGTLTEPSFAVVNNPNPADRLNLRTEPSKTAPSLGKYYSGVTVKVLGFYKDNQWARVRVGTLEGYMDANYLAMGDAAQRVKSAIPKVSVNVPQGQHLQLRNAPGSKATVLTRYAKGTPVWVYGITETWYHVQVNGIEGFMMAKYLTPQLPK